MSKSFLDIPNHSLSLLNAMYISYSILLEQQLPNLLSFCASTFCKKSLYYYYLFMK